MKITQALMDDLTAQAKASPRLRMNKDLRNSPEDKSQRMLNALEPGTPVPIHRHRKSSETVVCLRGHLKEVYYNDAGEVTEVIDFKEEGYPTLSREEVIKTVADKNGAHDDVTLDKYSACLKEGEVVFLEVVIGGQKCLFDGCNLLLKQYLEDYDLLVDSLRLKVYSQRARCAS